MRYIYIIFLFITIILLSSCEKKEENFVKKNTEIPQQNLPNQIITRFALSETIEGKKKWELLAQQARIFDDRKIIYVDSIYIEFYKLGEIYSTLKADSGIVYQERNDMEAIGNVVVITAEGEKLETERVRWDNKLYRIVSDEFVKVTRGNDVLTGVGFETDPDLKRIQVKKDVKAYVKEVK